MNARLPLSPDSMPSRRQFLQLGGAAALACAASSASRAAEPQSAPKKPAGKTLNLSLASYTFRSFDLDKTLAQGKRAGLKNICLKSMHMPLNSKPEEIAAIVAKVAAAGMSLYGAGLVDMTKEAQITPAFEYAKTAGLRIMVIGPEAALLPVIEQHVKKYDIAVAIHNHGPTDRRFPTPQSVYEKIGSLDRRVGLCVDIGHTARSGVDLVETVNKYHDRILEMHVKDETEPTASGKCVPLGRGVIDIPGMIRALVTFGYQGMFSYEYEAEEKDPLPGLCECVGYTKGVLATL